MGDVISLERVNQVSVANTEQTYRLLAGDTPGQGYFGCKIRPKWIGVHWSSAVTSISHKVELDSGLGSNYDVVLQEDTVSATDWVWYPDFDVVLMPKQSKDVKADALKVTIAAGGSGKISYLTVCFEVVE